jgi:hypothetical protein
MNPDRRDDRLAALAILETVTRSLANPSPTDGPDISTLIGNAHYPSTVCIELAVMALIFADTNGRVPVLHFIDGRRQGRRVTLYESKCSGERYA